MCVKRFVFFFFVFLFVTTEFSFAQKTHSGLQSEGDIPKLFLDYNTIYNKTNLKEKALFTNAFLIYGTDLNQYLDRFLIHLLSEESILKQHVKIYLYRSIEPNIYTTSDSIIIINIGLLAQIQNESELAFILSHELAHIYKNHTYTSDGYSKKEQNQHIDLFNKEHGRSEEDELEADQFGYIHFFLTHGYKTEDIVNVFMNFESGRILQSNAFHFKDFIIQQSYPFSNPGFIDYNENETENFPEYSDLTQKRIETFNTYKQQDNSENQSDIQFIKHKKIALDELLRLYVLTHDYLNALYLSSHLIKQFPDNTFYLTAWLASNYGVMKLKEKDSDFKWAEDQINSNFKKEIHYFYTQISYSELKSYVFRLTTHLSKEYPDNVYYKSLIQSINELNEPQKFTLPSNYLTIYDPKYQKINRDNESIKNLDDQLLKIIQVIADKNYFNVLIKKCDQLRFDNTEEYNHYERLQLLKYYILKHADTNFVYFPILDNKQVIQTNIISFINIQYRSVPDRVITRFYYLPLILLNPSSLPFTTAHVFANRARMRVQFVIFDTQSNTIKYNVDETFSDFNGKVILKQILFDQFVKINNP